MQRIVQIRALFVDVQQSGYHLADSAASLQKADGGNTIRGIVIVVASA